MRRSHRKSTPNVRPVQQIELSEKHMTARLILTAVLIVAAAALLVYALVSLLAEEPGWRQIEVQSSAGTNCSGDFIFQYNLGSQGESATTEYKKLSALYTEATENAYRLFHASQEFSGLHNLAYLNHHVNETVTVDPVLYDAFALLEEYGCRSLYLGPLCAEYANLFFCTDDIEAASYDPYVSDEAAAYAAEIAAFATDPEAIALELLGDCTVRLRVGERYLRYAEETGFTEYLDFFWLENAFIVDYLADIMLEQGYTAGSISSFDGFVRNLNDSDTAYSFNLFDRVGQTVYPAARMQYQGQISLVYLRNYPMNDLDSRHYYTLRSGEIRSPYLDTADGLCKSALNNLVAYSRGVGCAEVLLSIIPVYIADAFDESAIEALHRAGVETIYFRDYTVCASEAGLTIDSLYAMNGVRYTVK